MPASVLSFVSKSCPRCRKALYHVVISWPEGETPSDQQAEAAARHLLERIGFLDHQWILAVHRDTGNVHVHIMVCRVHPEAGRAHSPYRDWRDLDKSCRARAARMGKSVCPGRTLRMDELDSLVADALIRRVLDGDHLHRVLAGFLGRDAAAEEARRDRLTERRRELSEAEGGARRLLRMVESGLADLDDPLFRERVAQSRLRRDELTTEIRLLEQQADASSDSLTVERADAFASRVKEMLSASDRAQRRMVLHAMIGRVEVGNDCIRISGPVAELARLASAPADAAPTLVPSFVREWRPHGDSNPGCRRERAVS